MGTAGSGYVAGDVLTIASATIGGSVDVKVTLIAGDILIEPTTITVNAQGSGYAVGDTVTFAAATILGTDAIITLRDQDIIDTNAFTLETLTDGAIMNSVGPVSYTHLRAHETGRNLVCRLLLEKKK